MRYLNESFAATAEEEAIKINKETQVGLVTDQDFWEKHGIKTGEDLAKTVLSQTYSDYYKELHNIRPRWVDTSKMSVDDIQALIDGLDEEARLNAGHDDQWWDAYDSQDQPGWEDEMMDAARENPDALPDEWLDYDDAPLQQGMGRRPAGSKSQRRMESKTSKILENLIKEEILKRIRR